MKAINFKLFSVLSLLTILLFTSCLREESDSVNQDKIFTEYELFYNANEDKTYARAIFKFSNIFGTQLELSSPSQVTFNDEILTFNGVLAYYEKEYAGLVEAGTFQWTDTEGNIFTNSISINTIEYPTVIDTIVRSSSYDLIWEGAPLGEGENVAVVANGENELDARTFITNDVGAQNIILDKNKLEEIGQGEGTLYMDRRYLPGLLEMTDAGGIITGRYRPENKIVVFN